MANPIIIASLTFPSKVAAKAFFRNIRDRYQNGETIGSEDSGYLQDLMAIHPEAETKIGSGISRFTVEIDTRFRNTRHFMIHRTDGSTTDVSFHSAIDGRNERRDRQESLRCAIDDQIIEFRNSVFVSGDPIVCPLSGVQVTEASYHVDHVAPQTFVKLVDQWLASEGLNIWDIQITPPSDNQFVTQMTDHAQLLSWQTFHRTHATLRILSPRGNLSTAKLTK